jgi:serine/threonine protein kinase
VGLLNGCCVQLLTEIRVHRALSHPHVVHFHSYFEDDNNIYMMLELCTNRSLADMVRERGSLTEVEARLFMVQLLSACRYLHQHGIIHRDLKLGNVFLDSKMHCKVGDFGLATKLQTREERKKTVCGTPNYIAPEVLAGGEDGHSFEVDIWSLGVILYTMLVGRPPFETRDVNETYKLIREGRFDFPPGCATSEEARVLVRRMLQTDPTKRPRIEEILRDPWFSSSRAFCAAAIPASARSVAPVFKSHEIVLCKQVVDDELRSEVATLRRRIRTTGPGTEHPDEPPAATVPPPLKTKPLIAPPERQVLGAASVNASAGVRKGVAPPLLPLTSENRPVTSLAGLGPTSRPIVTTVASSSSASARPIVVFEDEDLGAGRPVRGAKRFAMHRSPQPMLAERPTACSVDGDGIHEDDDDVDMSPHKAPALSIRAPPPLTRVDSATETPTTGLPAPFAASSSSSAAAVAAFRSVAVDSPPPRTTGASSSSSAAAARTPADSVSRGENPSTLARMVHTLSRAGTDSAPSHATVEGDIPRLSVVKWVDYSSKYGLGFLLSNGSSGVHFMDMSKIVCASDGLHVEYWPAVPHDERPRDPLTGKRYIPHESFTTEEYPAELKKKITLLTHFRQYLLDHWKQATESGSALPEEIESVARGSPTSGLVYLKKWLRTEHAAVFRLSDRTVQACFFDGSSVTLNPDSSGAVFTDKHNMRSHHRLSDVMHGGNPSVVKRLNYVKDLLSRLVGSGSETAPGTVA